LKDLSTDKDVKEKNKKNNANCTLLSGHSVVTVYSLFLFELNYIIISWHYHVRHPSVQRALLDVRGYYRELYRECVTNAMITLGMRWRTTFCKSRPFGRS